MCLVSYSIGGLEPVERGNVREGDGTALAVAPGARLEANGAKGTPQTIRTAACWTRPGSGPPVRNDDAGRARRRRRKIESAQRLTRTAIWAPTGSRELVGVEPALGGH
jgi:hypothetical protein